MKLTLVLIFINIMVFLYSLSDFNNIINSYAFNPTKFVGGEYYRILTSIFLHANPLHLALNMLALLILGSAVENKIKKFRYSIIYFLGGMAANLVMLLPIFFSPNSLGVGASGAISALIGLGTFYSPSKLVFYPTFIPIPFVVAGAFYFITQYTSLFTPSYIAYPVHITGMIMGSMFGLFWVKDKAKKIILFLLSLWLVIMFPYIIRAIFVYFVS